MAGIYRHRTNRFIIILLCITLCIVSSSHAQVYEKNLKADSLSLNDSLPVTKAKYSKVPLKQFVLPASLIAVGAFGSSVDGMRDFHLISRKDSVSQIRIDDYLEWGMLGWVFMCDIVGKEKHSLADQFVLLAMAEGINAAAVHGLKNNIETTRPDGRPYSFPSGHTANAFLGAHMAYKEFKDSSPVLAYSGYAIAGFVAASRVYNNRHWLADVAAGAGIGILSVELSYLIYFPIKNLIIRKSGNKTANNLFLAPSIQREGGGFYLSYRF